MVGAAGGGGCRAGGVASATAIGDGEGGGGSDRTNGGGRLKGLAAAIGGSLAAAGSGSGEPVRWPVEQNEHATHLQLTHILAVFLAGEHHDSHRAPLRPHEATTIVAPGAASALTLCALPPRPVLTCCSEAPARPARGGSCKAGTAGSGGGAGEGDGGGGGGGDATGTGGGCCGDGGGGSGGGERRHVDGKTWLMEAVMSLISNDSHGKHWCKSSHHLNPPQSWCCLH